MNYGTQKATPLNAERFLQKYNHGVLTVSPNNTIVEAASCFFSDDADSKKHSIAVVVDDNNHVVGVLSLGDITYGICCFRQDIVKMLVKDIMTSNIYTAEIKDDVASVMERMAKHNILHMPVVDKGILKGIITRKDALEGLYNDASFELKYLTEFVFRSEARY
jgi:CBS domain-containing protein